MGPRHQAEGRDAADAAVGRRSDRRQVLERSEPEADAEIDTIAAWVDGGAPEGNRADLPAAPVFAEGWSIGKPDYIFTMRSRSPCRPTAPCRTSTSRFRRT